MRLRRLFNRAPSTPNVGLRRRDVAVAAAGADASRRRVNATSSSSSSRRESRRAKVAEIESFEYFPGDSEVYREWLSKQPIHRSYDRWLMMLFVGLVVGLLVRVTPKPYAREA